MLTYCPRARARGKDQEGSAKLHEEMKNLSPGGSGSARFRGGEKTRRVPAHLAALFSIRLLQTTEDPPGVRKMGASLRSTPGASSNGALGSAAQQRLRAPRRRAGANVPCGLLADKLRGSPRHGAAAIGFGGCIIDPGPRWPVEVLPACPWACASAFCRRVRRFRWGERIPPAHRAHPTGRPASRSEIIRSR